MRLVMLGSALAPALALAVASCAPAPAGDGAVASASTARACFYPDQVRNFSASTDRTLYIRTLTNQVFELNASACPGLDTSLSLGLQTSAGLSTVCAGDFVNVGYASGAPGFSPCRANVVKRLSDEEVEALPSRDRP